MFGNLLSLLPCSLDWLSLKPPQTVSPVKSAFFFCISVELVLASSDLFLPISAWEILAHIHMLPTTCSVGPSLCSPNLPKVTGGPAWSCRQIMEWPPAEPALLLGHIQAHHQQAELGWRVRSPACVVGKAVEREAGRQQLNQINLFVVPFPHLWMSQNITKFYSLMVILQSCWQNPF